MSPLSSRQSARRKRQLQSTTAPAPRPQPGATPKLSALDKPGTGKLRPASPTPTPVSEAVGGGKLRSPDISAHAQPTGPPVAYTVREFCAAHKISVAFYYQLKKEGRGPRELELNTRRIITAEDAADWRAGKPSDGESTQGVTDNSSG